MASSSRLAPLTRSDSSSSSYEPQTYSSRMAGVSRSSSFSSTGSGLSRRSSMSASAASNEPVIRNGFVIPKITLTPPDEKPQRSEPLPWQDFTSKTSLYVPVKTEDIGWEEGGLWWHGKFDYREVALYGGDDDHVCGKYRGGPEGYAYMDIWDKEAFNYQPPRKNHEPTPQKPTPSRSSSSSSAKRSSSSRSRTDDVSSSSSKRASSSRSTDSPDNVSKEGESSSGETSSSSISNSASSNLKAPAVHETESTVQSSESVPLPSSALSSRRNSEASSTFSSTCSSRRTSDSSYTEDTAATSPCDSPIYRSGFSALFECDDAQTVDSPVEGAAPFDKLEKALLALKSEKALMAKCDGRTEDGDSPSDGATTMRLQPGKSLTLSLDGPSASHRWPAGRGIAKMAERPIAGTRSSSSFESSPLNPAKCS